MRAPAGELWALASDVFSRTVGSVYRASGWSIKLPDGWTAADRSDHVAIQSSTDDAECRLSTFSVAETGTNAASWTEAAAMFNRRRGHPVVPVAYGDFQGYRSEMVADGKWFRGHVLRAGDFPLERQLAEAEAAERELAHVGAGAAAQPAAVAAADGVLGDGGVLDDLRGGGHLDIPYCARNGMPISWSSRRASSSVLADVTTEMFMPRFLSTFM